MLPTFLIIGSQKAGTTSTYHVLRRHPQIYMPDEKEIKFFFDDDLYRRGVPFYESFFAEAGDVRMIGEATPEYICHPDAPPRIKKCLPDVKLILSVRNPIDRAYSQYWDNRRQLEEPLTFEQTLGVALSTDYQPGKRGYFSRGFYYKYVERYLQYFDREQFLLVFFDDLRDNPNEFYRSCFAFLGVDETFECPEMNRRFNPPQMSDNPVYRFFLRNPRYYRYCRPLIRVAKQLLSLRKKHVFKYPPMDEATRQILVAFYREANDQLADFAGRDLGHWNR